MTITKNDDLQEKRELLKLKKRTALKVSLLPTGAYLCCAVIMLSPDWYWFMGPLAQVISMFIAGWIFNKTSPLFTEISKLKAEIEDESRGRWREAIEEQIREGALKPRPGLK